MWAGRRRNVTCRVLAEPDVVIEWLRGGRVIDPNETFSTVQTRVWRTSVGYLQVSETVTMTNDVTVAPQPSYHNHIRFTALFPEPSG